MIKQIHLKKQLNEEFFSKIIKTQFLIFYLKKLKQTYK